jgi:uncharacterized protein YuzB (UPF0349 family)
LFIEFCENNYGYEEVVKKLEENNPDYDFKIQPCIGCCGKCSSDYIAKIGNIYLTAENANELYYKIIYDGTET